MDHDGEATVAYASLIQTFNRYLLDQMTAESDSLGLKPSLIKSAPEPTSKSPLAQLLRVEAKTVSVCQQCGVATTRDNALSVIDLAMSNELPPASDFSTILRNSIHRETIARMVCPSCRLTNHLRIRRVLTDAPLPPVMVINAGVRTSDELEIWLDGRQGAGSRFLQKAFSIRRMGEAVVVEGMEKVEKERITGETVYELQVSSYEGPWFLGKRGEGESLTKVLDLFWGTQAMALQIQSEGDQPHLVALAQVAPGKWYLFNDFLVKPISEEEALSFPSTWKIPAVMFYQRVDADELLDFSSLPLSSEPGILCQDITISRNRDPTLIKHQPFTLQELPRRGTLVSIDAEFVSLQQEEAEFHSDGTKKVIRPSRMTLARVSVLRGEGPDTGIPFIDDHIHTSDTVVDYLTEFSGIRAGDLDPNVSRHTLVPLKVAYKKLRLLVDLGCVFIGHGLNKDFRIINIYIPPEQIIDTVNIYHQAHRQRKLSLRFLAWAVLHSAIQADTHDSIEDARTALQLYEEHNRLEAQGAWEDCLEEVYREGRQTNFKVPVVEPPPVANPPPTPMQQGLGALGPLHRPPPNSSRSSPRAGFHR
ncbi:PAB-dependent poly(A)-specific ribonuclease subunit 2, partial [Phenoliferia sp. Uapishka_3]